MTAQEAHFAGGKKEHEKVISMVPLFGRRSLITLAIGLLVGVGLGIAYFIISPLFSSYAGADSTLESGGSRGSFGPADRVPWKTEVNIQVVHQGSYLSAGTIQGAIISYAAKAKSLSFLEFLSQELAKQIPQYHSTVNELSRMISIQDENSALIPSYSFKIIVTAPTAEEATFLVTNVPDVFKSYLIGEESNKRKQEQQDTLKAIETVKSELIDAQREVGIIATRGDINNNPTYIALKTKVKALESQLALEASELSRLIAADNANEFTNVQQHDYQKTLQKIGDLSDNVTKAQGELNTLELKRNDISQDATYVALTAKINGLQAEIDKQVNGYWEMSADGTQTRVIGLAERITRGDTTSLDYKETSIKVERASAALVEARKEIARLQVQLSQNNTQEDMEYQAAKTKVENLNTELSTWKASLRFDTTSAALAEANKQLDILVGQAGDGSLAQDIDSQLAKTKVENLNAEMVSLNKKLDSSIASNIDTSIVNYLAVGNPEIPVPMPSIKLQTALMFGIVVGICGAWVALNFTWLSKGMPSSKADVPKPKDDEDVEA